MKSSLGKTPGEHEAMPMLKKIFARDKSWKELTRRLPEVNLLTVSADDLKKIMAL